MQIIEKISQWWRHRSIPMSDLKFEYELEDKLNRLGREVISLYPLINRGGCGIYAAIVAAELRKQNIYTKGIVASALAAYIPNNISNARNKIKRNTVNEWYDNGISFGHVGIEFTINKRKKHYDADGVHLASKNLGCKPIYKGRLEYDELLDVARRKDGWNEEFNRNVIPELRKLVKKRLSTV